MKAKLYKTSGIMKFDIIEVNSIKDICLLVEKYDNIIISNPHNKEFDLEIEIYDTYRE
jgi:predicted nucleic acid-binding protein